MKIEAYLLCWNEKTIMPLVVKHYQKFCDTIFILDNHSTDGSQELAKELCCVVIPFGTKFFDDSENQKVKNECWKNSTADWVVIADFDEILFDVYAHTDDESSWHAARSLCDLETKLNIFKDQNVTIIKTIGWQIISDEMPKNDLLEITNGYRFDNYSKNIVFDPKRIKEINYNPGAHKIDPVGDVVYSTEELYVLHYKHIGGVQRTIDRYKEYQPRMSKNNRKNGWGVHYNRTPASIREEWNERMAKSKPLI